MSHPNIYMIFQTKRKKELIQQQYAQAHWWGQVQHTNCHEFPELSHWDSDFHHGTNHFYKLREKDTVASTEKLPHLYKWVYLRNNRTISILNDSLHGNGTPLEVQRHGMETHVKHPHNPNAWLLYVPKLIFRDLWPFLYLSSGGGAIWASLFLFNTTGSSPASSISKYSNGAMALWRNKTSSASRSNHNVECSDFARVWM